MHLYADGIEKEKAVLSAANQWKHTFADLDEHIYGNVIQYTVSEDPIEGYSTSITGNAKEGFVITNSLSGKVSVGVTKEWVGAGQASATIRLLADGQEVKSQVLNQGNNWQYTFQDLDQYKNGKEIVYTVEEDPIEGYKTEITGDATKGFTVRNINTATISIPVQKAWVGKPGTQATVQLLADGTEKQSQVLNADNGWKYTFTGLPKYNQVTGEEIKYTVTEVPVDGYIGEISGDATKGFSVRNTEVKTDTPTSTPNGNISTSTDHQNDPAPTSAPNAQQPVTADNSNIVGWSILLMTAFVALIYSSKHHPKR